MQPSNSERHKAYQFMHSATSNMYIKYFIGSHFSVPFHIFSHSIYGRITYLARIYRVAAAAAATADVTTVAVPSLTTHSVCMRLEGGGINPVSCISNFICMIHCDLRCVAVTVDVACLPAGCLRQHKSIHASFEFYSVLWKLGSHQFTKLKPTESMEFHKNRMQDRGDRVLLFPSIHALYGHRLPIHPISADWPRASIEPMEFADESIKL